MLGAILGDIIGSPYEFSSDKTKDFELFTPACRLTDDSLMTIAVGCACIASDPRNEYSFKTILAEKMREIGRLYPDAGFGHRFYDWLLNEDDGPYGGKTNGSAMRVSPTAWLGNNIETVERLAKWSAEITHNHPEGIKGAQAVAAAVFLARTGHDKSEIREYIEENYYTLNFTVDEIREGYQHDMTCEGSVPQAIVCFLDATDFEDAVRNAVSLGGDGDTQACIAGAIAEAYYGVPEELEEIALSYMDETVEEYFNYYAEVFYK